MKKSTIKTALASGVIFLALGLFASEAFSWGFATHAYVNDQIGMERRPNNRSEIYGAMVGDLFNYLFNYPLYAEKEFRKSIVLYVQALQQDEETAIGLIAQQTADLDESFLALYDIQIPLTKEEIVGLIIDYMNLAISICEPDYFGEIIATANFVDGQLQAHAIAY